MTPHVSVEAARKPYGVVLDPASGKLDLPATKKVRKAIRSGSP